jgi:pimeloyl-ACP methyl ester carboxylesterase
MTLTMIAHALVDRGCRVMLFVRLLRQTMSTMHSTLTGKTQDLFGRGFSDGVGDVPHDSRLYTTQMLCVLASSHLPWTGAGAITVIGYSLGGGIAIHFANAFPHVVRNLILLAPAGLIRAANFGTVSQLLFKSGLVPERVLAVLTARRLQQPISSSRVKLQAAEADVKVKEDFVDVAIAEAADLECCDADLIPLEKQVLHYVRWMVVHHRGFVPAFMSSIRHAPLTDQHDAWRGLAKRQPGTTAILLARTDEIVDAKDYAQDALPLIGGEENVLWKVMPGGHDFVMTHHEEVMAVIDDFWKS